MGKGLATLTAPPPAVLSTPEAAEADETGAAAANEYRRYERVVLDFEAEVVRRRDALRAEHLANMKAIFAGDAEGDR
ncbi:MAG TPA: hypothetical protein VME69_10990 [Methylocella sp.]|nr:hypothetical protein [Methylocella sp.]